MKICVFDPSIRDHQGSPSKNLGDLIIQEAVHREIISIFGNCEITRIHTHTPINLEDIDKAQDSSLIFIGGTNILGASKGQWAITDMQKLQIARAILLGAGWNNYEVQVTNILQLWRARNKVLYRIFLKYMLSSKFLHSVRDEYSKNQIESIGIKNVLNTGCPTMWPFVSINTEETIPRSKSENALLLLSDYRNNSDLDKKLLELIFSKYKKVFFWPQGSRDLQYVSNMNFPFTVLERSLEAFNNFLNSGVEVDYIGTRLHGGVKCLLAKKRSLILEIDNRAKEIAKDTGLPTCSYSDIDYVSRWIDGPSVTSIKMNSDSINRWKSQFTNFDYSRSSHKEKRLQTTISRLVQKQLTR